MINFRVLCVPGTISMLKKMSVTLSVSLYTYLVKTLTDAVSDSEGLVLEEPRFEMTVTIQDNAACHRLDDRLHCQLQAVDDRPRGEQSTPELSSTAPWEQLMLTVITQRSR